jgi:hypothetical protein
MMVQLISNVSTDSEVNKIQCRASTPLGGDTSRTSTTPMQISVIPVFLAQTLTCLGRGNRIAPKRTSTLVVRAGWSPFA